MAAPPVLCFECGHLLGDKYELFTTINQSKNPPFVSNQSIDIAASNRKNIAMGDVLDTLGITRQCCRMHMLTYMNFIPFYQ